MQIEQLDGDDPAPLFRPFVYPKLIGTEMRIPEVHGNTGRIN
jgi:hypothetical protein